MATRGRAGARPRRPGSRQALLRDIREARLRAFVDDDVYVALPPRGRPGRRVREAESKLPWGARGS
eukprot:13913360-Alexandrium_andersonii.AAC.1